MIRVCLLFFCVACQAPAEGATESESSTAAAQPVGETESTTAAGPAGEIESTAEAEPADETEPAAEAGPEVLPCKPAPEGMTCVPGGWFVRGVDKDPHWPCHQIGRPKRAPPDAEPSSRVWVQTFYMDLTEVTNEAYTACIVAKKCKRAGPRYSDFSRPKQPITGIRWHDAEDFCASRGKRLPTEAEWEKAARGPDGDIYPWGNDPVTCERAVILSPAKGGRSCGIKKDTKRGSATVGRVLAVGSRPAGRYGIFDMVGNAEEWTADWYSESWQACGEDCAGIAPKGPCAGKARCPGHPYKALRGGSWYWPAGHATGYHRRPHFPKNRPFHHYGFRCAASLKQVEAMGGSRP